MPKDDAVYVGHMLDTVRKIVAFTLGKTRADFDVDEVLRLALAHLIQIVGEAASRVSEPFRSGHPQIPWRAIVGMRHKVVHDYMALDDEVVWETVTHEIPALLSQLERLAVP